MEKIIGIYKIENIKNNKVYVGQSHNIYQRWKEHISGKRKSYISNAIKKYGIDSFKFSILEKINHEYDNNLICCLLDFYELFYISLFKSTNKKYGYNLTYGGYDNKMTPIVKEKIRRKTIMYIKEKGHPMKDRHHTKKSKLQNSLAQKGKKSYWYGKKRNLENRRKISNFRKTFHYSEKSKQKMSLSRIGFKVTQKTKNKISKNSVNKKKVLCIEQNKIYDSIAEAAKKNKIYATSISAVCKNKRKTANKLHWRYHEE